MAEEPSTRPHQGVEPDRAAQSPECREPPEQSASPVQKGGDASGDIYWDEATLDTGYWFEHPDVPPRQAVMLLCRFNPLEDEFVDVQFVQNDEIGPIDFKRLVERFEAVARVDGRPRRLSDWLDVASVAGLKVHSWINRHDLPRFEPEPSKVAGATVSGPLESKPNRPSHAKKRSETWMDVHGDYLVSILISRGCATAKDLYKAISEAAENEDGSPFWLDQDGLGEKLVSRSTNRRLSLKTLQNGWGELKRRAKDRQT